MPARSSHTVPKVHCAKLPRRYPCIRMKLPRIAGALAALALFHALGTPTCAQTKPPAAADDSALSLAICPIVYPVDQASGERGYHYIFYGNGFFINKEGYLLTAAHVLSQLNEAQVYILLRSAVAPPRLLPATLVAIDREHDVAILQATPNPFEGKYQVRFLPLQVESPARSQAVMAAALRPSRLRDPHTFDKFAEDRPAGEVLGFQFSAADKGHGDTELLLFSHEVLLGDSGAPVVSTESQAVVGLVKGRWLRPNAASLAVPVKQSGDGVGAVLPIHYAISLLQQHGVAWQVANREAGEPAAAAGESSAASLTPVPLSLVAAPYPAQALHGGEVVLDALVDRSGQLTDIRVVRGGAPFLDKVLSAVRTWSFLPARVGGEAVESRIGIAFQFAQPTSSSASKRAQQFDVSVADAPERAPAPTQMTEPDISGVSAAESRVILSAQIDERGHAVAVKVLREEEPLGSAAASAVGQWQFAPGKKAGTKYNATFIVVEIVRGGTLPSPARTGGKSRTLAQ